MSPHPDRFLPAAGSQQARVILDGLLCKTALRIVVIAADKASGYMEARNLGIEPVAVVTPRSKHAGYGVTADRIMDATSLTIEQRELLMPYVLPSIATARKPSPLR